MGEVHRWLRKLIGWGLSTNALALGDFSSGRDKGQKGWSSVFMKQNCVESKGGYTYRLIETERDRASLYNSN
jgi:hypothetical protein